MNEYFKYQFQAREKSQFFFQARMRETAKNGNRQNIKKAISGMN